MIDKLLALTSKVNGEREVKLHSVIVHETETGYAQCFAEDAYSKEMGIIDLREIVFSKQIQEDFRDKNLWKKVLQEHSFINPVSV
jgi:6-pyruvoyltetrahydropterin/6-carboxytetrahydropterin synthase